MSDHIYKGTVLAYTILDVIRKVRESAHTLNYSHTCGCSFVCPECQVKGRAELRCAEVMARAPPVLMVRLDRTEV